MHIQNGEGPRAVTKLVTSRCHPTESSAHGHGAKGIPRKGSNLEEASNDDQEHPESPTLGGHHWLSQCRINFVLPPCFYLLFCKYSFTSLERYYMLIENLHPLVRHWSFSLLASFLYANKWSHLLAVPPSCTSQLAAHTN